MTIFSKNRRYRCGWGKPTSTESKHQGFGAGVCSEWLLLGGFKHHHHRLRALKRCDVCGMKGFPFVNRREEGNKLGGLS